MKAQTSRPLLDPNTVARRLRRPLAGDSSAEQPTDEYLLLHLLNSAQRDHLEELLVHSEDYPRIGRDLITLVRNRLRRGGGEGDRPPIEYSVPVPAPVWDRYAQRAREGHRRIDSVLVDALLRDDLRLRQGQKDAIDARETFREQARELSRQLVALKAALADHQAGTPQLETERQMQVAVEDLRRQTAAQGIGLAAVLRVLHDKGWVAKALVTALKARGWLTE